MAVVPRVFRWLPLAAALLLAGCSTTTRSGNPASPPTLDTRRPGDIAISVQAPTATLPALTPTPLPVPSIVAGGDQITQVIATAKSWLGVPYHWGGCSKSGVDCSCFVRNVLATIGINAPRVTTQQIQWATPVSASAAQPLDLVFFDNTCSGCGPNPTHVGLYLGGGTMIDAGDPVRIEPVYSGHNARYGRPPGL